MIKEDLFKKLTRSDRVSEVKFIFDDSPINVTVLSGMYKDQAGKLVSIGFRFNGLKWESYGTHG